MDNIDLNIDNYDLYDILSLFKLDIDFGSNELKQSYKMTLMTHPDKSHLDKKYFLFFSQAFKILKQIYDFNINANKCVRLVNDDSFLDDKEHKLLIEKIKSKPNFNKWFNEMFEKMNINDDEQNRRISRMAFI